MRNPDFYRALGKRITALRKEYELTQAELAQQLGLSQQTVFAIECGFRRVSLDVVPRLWTAAHILSRFSGASPRQQFELPRGWGIIAFDKAFKFLVRDA